MVQSQTAAAIEVFRKSYDVFRCSIGDIDESFELEYYQNRNLVRKFVFEHDVSKNTQTIIVDTGTKLPGEPATLNDRKVSAEKMFPTITQALGIVRVTDPLQNRFYAKITG